MNIFTEQKQTHRLWKTYSYQRGQVGLGEEGWTGGLGLAYAHWGLWNDWPTATCCRAQGTLPIFYDHLHGKRIWKPMDMCACITESLCCTAEVITTFSKLCEYFNKSIKKKEKEKDMCSRSYNSLVADLGGTSRRSAPSKETRGRIRFLESNGDNENHRARRPQEHDALQGPGSKEVSHRHKEWRGRIKVRKNLRQRTG